VKPGAALLVCQPENTTVAPWAWQCAQRQNEDKCSLWYRRCKSRPLCIWPRMEMRELRFAPFSSFREQHPHQHAGSPGSCPPPTSLTKAALFRPGLLSFSDDGRRFPIKLFQKTSSNFDMYVW
jgi:hypothetical protein